MINFGIHTYRMYVLLGIIRYYQVFLKDENSMEILSASYDYV